MNRSSFKSLLPLVAATVGIGGASLYAAEPSYEELKQRVAELEQRVGQIETRPVVAAQDVDATVARVLEDADRRSQLLQAGNELTAGYDKGFFIKSADGSFSLKPGIQFQFRGVSNFNDANSDEHDTGFEARRVRLRFDGNAISPDLTYSFVWDTNRNGGGVTLLDAWARYQFADDWAVRLGQFKESFSQEKNVSGFSQLAVDRSLVDAVLGGALTDRVQGVSLIYGDKQSPLRGEVAFHDGARSINTDFRDEIPGTPSVEQGEFGAGARLEYKLAGDWASYRDFTAKGTKADLLVFGAGADFTQRDASDTLLTTVDAQWEGPGGLGVFGALHGNFTDLRDDALADDSRFDYGGLVQAGYLLNQQWEVFGRYDVVVVDDDFVTGEDVFNEFTAGVNYYLGADGSAGHRAKLTLDAVYLPDGAPSTQSGLGIVNSGEEEQFLVRGQFQLLL